MFCWVWRTWNYATRPFPVRKIEKWNTRFYRSWLTHQQKSVPGQHPVLRERELLGECWVQKLWIPCLPMCKVQLCAKKGGAWHQRWCAGECPNLWKWGIVVMFCWGLRTCKSVPNPSPVRKWKIEHQVLQILVNLPRSRSKNRALLYILEAKWGVWQHDAFHAKCEKWGLLPPRPPFQKVGHSTKCGVLVHAQNLESNG